MLESFKAALARIQGDFDFYVACQTEPDAVLAEYDLSASERAALTDPDELARVLQEDLRPRNIPSITVKISGRHDWVNRTPKKSPRQEHVVHEVAAVRAAGNGAERVRAALELVDRLG